jgi:hypothetical protein
MSRAAWLVLVVGCVASGCDDGLRTLSRSDVTGIPPGDAIGSPFSGRYALLRGRRTACDCRAGSCSGITINDSLGTVTVVQNDGAFTSSNELFPTVICSGGIDADGQFVCGQISDSPPVLTLSLTTGQIALANGQPTTMTGSSDTTAVLPGFDCDIQVEFEAAFVGP